MYFQLIPSPASAVPLTPAGQPERPHHLPRHPKLVENWLPFLTAALVHAGIICFIILAFQAASAVYRNINRPAEIIPETAAINQNAGALPPGLKVDSKPLSQNLLPQVQTAGLNMHPNAADLRSALTSSGGSPGDVAISLIAIGPHATAGTNGQGGFFSDIGQGLENGDAARFGKGGLDGDQSIFARSSIGPNKPQRIVFICDASGSMMSKFDDLRLELHKAIKALLPISSYNVIFFQEADCKAIDPRQLLPANSENKRRGMTFVDSLSPRGTTDPIPSLRSAFAMNPQAVFLLTDGDFPDNQAVLDEVRKLEAHHAVAINTIAFIDHNESYEKLLQGIAHETGGTFRYVSQADLGQ